MPRNFTGTMKQRTNFIFPKPTTMRELFIQKAWDEDRKCQGKKKDLHCCKFKDCISHIANPLVICYSCYISARDYHALDHYYEEE